MHLPQIAALPKVAEDLAEPGRAAHPASEGDGFLSVFSGGPAVRVLEPSGSEPPALIRSARAAVADFAQVPGTEDPRARATGAAAPGAEAIGVEAPGTGATEAEAPWTGATAAEPPWIGSPGAEAPVTGATEAEARWIWATEAEAPWIGATGADAPVTKATDVEARRTGATAMGALLPRADRMPETTDVKQPPAEGTSRLVPDESTHADGQSSGGHAAELTSDVPADIALPDDHLLPGLAVPVPASGGATPGRAAEAFAQAPAPVRLGRETGDGGTPTSVGADGGDIEVSENTDFGRRVLHAPAMGSEKPVQSPPTGVPDVAGSAARSGTAPVDPRMMPVDPDMRTSPQLARVAPQAGTALQDGQGRPEGNSGDRGAEFRPAGPIAPGTTRLDGAGAVKLAGHGQIATAATENGMPTESRQGPPEARGPRAEARSAAEAVVPTSQGPSQAANSTMQHSAAATPPAGSGVEAGAAPLGGGFAAPGAGDGLFNVDPAMSDIALGDARGTARGPSAATLPVLQSPDTPRLVAMQIAEVVRASGERGVELRLQPEELGRVQLTMSQDATGTLTVSLNVERPETLDLLRRNIDLLGADLHELGYENIDFSFQGDGAGAQQDARPDFSDGRAALDADAAPTSGDLPQTGVRGAQASGEGIDIRL